MLAAVLNRVDRVMIGRNLRDLGDLFYPSRRLTEHPQTTPSLQPAYARRELLIHENES